MTDSTRPLPLLGAALTLDTLALHRDWIFERQRDLELQDFCFAEVLSGDWRSRADAARTALAGYRGRLGIHGPFWSLPLAADDPEIRAVVARRMAQGLDVCEAIGATQMVIHSPYTTWDHANLDEHRDARARLIERAHLTLDAAVARARDIGTTLVIENIEDKDPHARVELAASFDAAVVRVSLDTGHAHYAHGSTGAPPVDRYVQAAGAALDHVHIQDADGYADRHWLPGEGTVAWPAVFRAVAKYCDRPRLLIEVKDQVGLRRGADHLVGLGLAE
ncbi:sugar phosphate isomerase/epimerase [Siculibacillus lacustris]|uniref:Sugar phosphate isomerase/epimerase n=1 Tax=Siculibacillus lacustris TaxID=1549641 RepID=A0A4Q9VIW5_9HYPH|nr:sugar phosphate isomerase/epimerase family protein [Siculibacillus lacustris]TBW35213.1 sugar phosphate isomerase/epimerase [Siculibacillus lacustris]